MIGRQTATTFDAAAQDAMRAAFEQYYAPLVRLCLLLCGRYDMAEDIVQDVFVRMAGKIEHIQTAAVGHYLRRAVVNAWKNRLRRLALERRAWSQHERREEPGSPSAPPMEEKDAIWHAVTRLPNKQRACLVLRYYEDLPERSVAEILGCSVGTVKSHTDRALARLGKDLRDED